MQKFIGLAVLVTATLFVFGVLWDSPVHSAQGKIVRDYIAIVNGKKISKEKYEREFANLKRRIAASGRRLTPIQELELKKNLLESLINRELLYQQSQKVGITVGQEQIEKQLVAVKKHYPDDATFKKALEKAHYTESGIKDQLRRAIAIEKFIDQELKSKIQITDKDVRDYYDNHKDLFRRPAQIRASHILVKLGPNPTKEEKEKALKKIKKIQERLKKGDNFAELAKKYSEGPSAKKGGDLGYFSRGQMVKPFEDAAFALDKGQVSDVVQTVFGYHLIKVTDKRPETTLPFEKVKDRLKQYLVEQKLQKMVRNYAENLKKKAKVERFASDLP